MIRQAAREFFNLLPDVRGMALARLPGREQLVRLVNGPAAEHLPHSVLTMGSWLWCRYREHLPLSVPVRGATVCLFAHFDRDGMVEDYVLHHLACLKAAGVLTIFVSTSRLRPDAVVRAAPVCAAILDRDNVGLDFGSWRTGLLVYPQLWECETLLFANDSVYGPLGELRPAIERMAATGCDFWGVTESLQYRRHYQSYFLGFHRSCLGSRAFSRFVGEIRLLRDKDQIIRRYEVGLRKRLVDQGLRGEVLVPARPGQSRDENPTLHWWRESIEAGAPYLKVQLLRENPYGQLIDDWPEVVAARGYDPGLIEKHLRRFPRQPPRRIR